MQRRYGWLLAAACLAAAMAGACSEDESSDANTGTGGGAGADAGGDAGSGGKAGADAASEAGGSAGAHDGGSDADATPPSDAAVDADADDAASDGATDATSEDAPAATDADADDGDASDASSLPALLPYPPVPYPPENPRTTEKEILGKILFWDEQMSADDTVACGTCHRAAAGGSDPRANQPTAIHPGPDGKKGTPDDVHGGQGIKHCTIPDGGGAPVYSPETPEVFWPNVQVTNRKPAPYLDSAFAPSLYWDGRATSQFLDPQTNEVAIQSGGALESQITFGPPITTSEMACDGRTWDDVVAKITTAVPLAKAKSLTPDIADWFAAIQADGGTIDYPTLFQLAFGDPQVTGRRIAFAIATHERRLVSDHTPFDAYAAGDTTALTQAQVHGMDVFFNKGRCALCHPQPLFTDNDFHNVAFEDPYADLGRQAITHAPNNADLAKFKTPTVRNVKLREAGGLMHNGADLGSSLALVVSMYSSGGGFGSHENIDPLMQPLGLTQKEQTDLIDFMRNGLTDPRVEQELPPFDHPTLSTE